MSNPFLLFLLFMLSNETPHFNKSRWFKQHESTHLSFPVSKNCQKTICIYSITFFKTLLILFAGFRRVVAFFTHLRQWNHQSCSHCSPQSAYLPLFLLSCLFIIFLSPLSPLSVLSSLCNFSITCGEASVAATASVPASADRGRCTHTFEPRARGSGSSDASPPRQR